MLTRIALLGRVAGTIRAGEVLTLITSGEYGDSRHISRSDCERDVVTEVEGTCKALDSSLPLMKFKNDGDPTPLSATA